MRTAAAAALLALGMLAGCAHDPRACDLDGFLRVQRAHATGAEVTLCGTVVRVRPMRRSGGGRHRIFVVDVGGGDRVEVDANVAIMGDFAVRAGEAATVRGEYYHDGPGRDGVHWTHRSTGRHAAGFVTLDGRTYF